MKLHVRLLSCLVLSLSVILLLPAVALSAGPKGTPYTFKVPKQGSMDSNATYYCWIPESVATLRCVIVHQHGCTREGDAPLMINDVEWLTFAKKWHAAFIAPHLVTGPTGSGSTECSNWCVMSNGSGLTFLAALDTLARKSGHSEITTIPWALWGHSGGSMWSTAMLGQYPNRIAVVVAQACGVDVSTVPGALKVPVLHHNGRKDMCYNDSYFGSGRAKGALWAHAINPYPLWLTGSCAAPHPLCWDTTVYGHAPHDLRMIAIPWMDIALTSRLPDKAGDSVLKDMDTSNAWLGDTTTRAIASAASFTGNKLRACWFPNQRFALLWKEYMTNGTIQDSSPVAPAPYNLAGTYSNRQIALKWDADADIQEGIQTFVVYRNGTVLQKMQWPNAPTTLFTTVKGFQRWDDGDQPNPSPAPAMTYTDNTVTDTGAYSYQVSTVNWAFMEGPKSGTILLKNGQVGAISELPSVTASASKWSNRLQISLTGGKIYLPAGTFDVYDIGGRLVASFRIDAAKTVDVKAIFDSRSNCVVVMKKRIP